MDIFVKRPVISIVLSLVILFAGGYSAFKIPILQFPRIESSKLLINTAYPGASANMVQGFITDPIESVAMSVPGIDFIDSSTSAGMSTVTLWLNLNENSSSALAELTSRLNQIKAELPADSLDPSVSIERSDQATALFYLDVNSEHWPRAKVTDYLMRNVTPQLSSIDGVQRIGVEGGRNPAMRVWLNSDRLAAMGLGADDVLSALAANNVLAAIGKTESAGQQINLLTNATMQTVKDFEALVVKNSNGSFIRLKDIARVELGEDRGEDLARLNQSETIFLSVWSLPGVNAISIGNEVYKRLEGINRTLPDGLRIDIGYDATVYMRNALKEIATTLLETIILVGLVVLFLMGSLRTALVPFAAIPLSILGAIAVINLMGFSLNLLTILAIVLCVGLVVDDAIVVVENIARHMREGKSRIRAAFESSRELLSPIIAMTLTLTAVYLPIGFISGITGALFREFTFTLAIAVLISGIVAVTLSPIMSAYVCSEKGREGRGTKWVNRCFDRLRSAYGRALDTIFDWRSQILFLTIFLSLLIIPFYLFSAKELAPIEDQGSIQMIIEAPPDANVAYTGQQMQNVVDLAYKLPGFDNTWQSLSPRGGFAGLEFVDYADRTLSVHQLRPVVYQKLSAVTGLRILPIMPSALPTAGQFDVEMVIQGPDDYKDLESHAQRLIGEAYKSGHFIFVDTDLKINQPQVRLKLDHDRITDLGMDIQKVSHQLSVLLSEQEVNRFNGNGKSYRVIPMVDADARSNPQTLMDLQLRIPNGELIPVRSIASIERLAGPQSLGKFNQQRAFRIQGGIHAGTTTAAALNALEKIADNILPGNFTVDYAGVSRALRKEGNSMYSVLLISLCLVYLMLAVQFNSFRTPCVVLAGSVPLALSGAMMFSFIGLTTINIYTQIGIITLVGLVAKNGILISEFANQLQQEGLDKKEAVKQAAMVRLRPILMTTLATVVGHFPLVLVSGPGAEARNSIGIILVAGMAIGTVFTLFVLPCVYLMFGESFPVKDKGVSGTRNQPVLEVSV